MNRFLISGLLALLFFMNAGAQDAGSTYKKANQQYVLFESERDKGANANSMYAYLMEAYTYFVQVTKEPNNASFLDGTKTD